MTEVRPEELENAGSDTLLAAGGGGGTARDDGFEDGRFASSATPAPVVIVKGMGVKTDVLNLGSSSPSVPADEEDRDRPKESFRTQVIQANIGSILGFWAMSNPLDTA